MFEGYRAVTGCTNNAAKNQKHKDVVNFSVLTKII